MRWKSSQPALAEQVASDAARLMPAPPRWLLAVPDAIRQLEKLDRDLLTRRDVGRATLPGSTRARGSLTGSNPSPRNRTAERPALGLASIPTVATVSHSLLACRASWPLPGVGSCACTGL